MFRSIEEKDFEIIKKLHEEFFPVRYSDQFYVDACKGIINCQLLSTSCYQLIIIIIFYYIFKV